MTRDDRVTDLANARAWARDGYGIDDIAAALGRPREVVKRMVRAANGWPFWWRSTR